MIRILCALLAAAAALVLAACGNAASTPPSVAYAGQPTPTPTPFNGRLYVEYAPKIGSASAAGIGVYALPLSPSSTPLFVIPQNVGPLAFDPHGNMFTSLQDAIAEFTFPFSASSVPVTAISRGSQTIPQYVSDIGFDGNGNLWAQTSSDVRDFVPPIGVNSIAQTIVSGASLSQLIFSPSGTMYTGNSALHFGATDTIRIYKFYPYTAPPTTIAGAQFGIPIGFYPDGTISISSTGANVVEPPGTIAPPGLEIVNSIGATTTVQYIVPFTVTNQATLAHSGAVDQAGTTYVLDGARNNALEVYAYPMGPGSAPQFHIQCVPAPGGCLPPVGVYLGP